MLNVKDNNCIDRELSLFFKKKNYNKKKGEYNNNAKIILKLSSKSKDYKDKDMKCKKN